MKRYDSIEKKSDSSYRDRSYEKNINNYKYKPNFKERKYQNYSANVKIFFESKFIYNLEKDDFLYKLQKKFDCDKIYIDKHMRIPNSDGKFIVINDSNKKIKFKCVSKLIKDFYNYSDHYNKLKDKEIKIITTIPDSITSQFIGSNGRNINSIKDKCNVNMIINPPIPKMKDRLVNISGYYKNIVDSIERTTSKVENLLFDDSKLISKDNEEDKKILDKTIEIDCKFIFDSKQVEFLNNNDLIKNLSEEFKFNFEFLDLTNDEIIELKHVHETDKILLVTGKLEDVQEFTSKLVKVIGEYYENLGEVFEFIKIIISNNFVTKLIGTKGSMIREIAARSSGAQIKILSDRESEKSLKDCVVTIAGSISNKQDATKIIIEQIEIFKHNIPIKMTTKTITQNIINEENYTDENLNRTEKKDPTKNISYTNKNEETKINSLIIVPDYLIKHLDNEKLNNIEKETNTIISIKKDNNNNILTSEGIKGRLIRINGKLENTSISYEKLLREIMNLENNLNGIRLTE